jgi:chorismate dehydratase
MNFFSGSLSSSEAISTDPFRAGGKIRIGAVSYLNTKPLLYGISKSGIGNSIEMVLDYPARIATLLAEDKIDAGLVPVAVIPELKEQHIITDYCIGCDGPVASVCLFSEAPLQEVKTVLLDYQSRTSAALARILLKNYWKLSPEIRDTEGEEYRHLIGGATAGLVIGDRAFEQRRVSTFIYDLGEAWKDYTGLNFVFAAWVSNKPLSPDFIRQFNDANGMGLQHIDEVLKENTSELFDLKRYYSHFINYNFDERKKVGMEEFLFQLSRLKNEMPVVPAVGR